MVCKFVVDRAVLPPNASVQLSSRQEGLSSPLVDALFAIPGVGRIYATGPNITVTKDSPRPWQEIGKEVGAAIRSVLQSGQPPFSAELQAKLTAEPSGRLKDEVVKLFHEKINPAIAEHGGFVELVKIIDNDVYLRLGGGCQGCASSLLTLKQGIEKEIRDAIPTVRHIIDDTDHAAGENPYYT